MSQITPEQMEKLLALAAGRLGTTPEQLKTALRQQGLQGLGAGLTAQDAARAEAVLQNKDQLAALLADPSVRRLLEQLLD